jgi:hypothetical protein
MEDTRLFLTCGAMLGSIFKREFAGVFNSIRAGILA